MTRSGQYWAFAHFSRHVRRGAAVFATNGLAPESASPQVTHCGFTNPDDTNVLVIANTGAQQRIQLVMASNAVDIDLPADSVHTLTW